MVWSLNPAVLLPVNEQWILALLNALLRPMYDRHEAAPRGSRERARYNRIFLRMLDACDCFPYAAIIDAGGFWFLHRNDDYIWGDES